MDNKRPGENLRKTVRCMVDDSRRQCELCVDARRMTTWLQDESTGGFGVLVEGLAGLEVGQTAELHTDTGWFVVRVMHIQAIDSSELEGIEGEEQGTWYRLGLARLGVASLPVQSTSWWPVDLFHRHVHSSSGMFLGVFVFLVIFAVILPLGLLKLNWHSDSTGTGRSTQWIDVKTSDNAPRRESSPTLPERKISSSSRESGRLSGAAGLSKRSRQDLQATLRRLPGPTVFTLPRVVEQLQLSPEQQEKIQRIIDDMTKAIRDLDREWAGRQRRDIDKIRGELLDRSRTEAMKLLTNEQLKIWDELVGASPR
jgi:hypothetical protein